MNTDKNLWKFVFICVPFIDGAEPARMPFPQKTISYRYFCG